MTLAKPTFGGRYHAPLGPGTDPYQAFTFHGKPIVKASFRTRKEALWWADNEGHRWPDSKIVQTTKSGPRVLWREADTRQRMAA